MTKSMYAWGEDKSQTQPFETARLPGDERGKYIDISQGTAPGVTYNLTTPDAGVPHCSRNTDHKDVR
jgi:hypothetical protein